MGVGQGVIDGNQSPFALKCVGAFVLLSSTNQSPRRVCSPVRETLLT
jgi:hypothetical protein